MVTVVSLSCKLTFAQITPAAELSTKAQDEFNFIVKQSLKDEEDGFYARFLKDAGTITDSQRSFFQSIIEGKHGVTIKVFLNNKAVNLTNVIKPYDVARDFMIYQDAIDSGLRGISADEVISHSRLLQIRLSPQNEKQKPFFDLLAVKGTASSKSNFMRVDVTIN